MPFSQMAGLYRFTPIKGLDKIFFLSHSIPFYSIQIYLGQTANFNNITVEKFNLTIF